jgi:chromosome segregation ATPase
MTMATNEQELRARIGGLEAELRAAEAAAADAPLAELGAVGARIVDLQHKLAGAQAALDDSMASRQRASAERVAEKYAGDVAGIRKKQDELHERLVSFYHELIGAEMHIKALYAARDKIYVEKDALLEAASALGIVATVSGDMPTAAQQIAQGHSPYLRWLPWHRVAKRR